MQSKATVSYQGGKQSYTFPFPYLSKQFVKVRYEGGSGTTNLEYNRDYSVEGQSILLRSVAPANVTVYVYRQTPTSSLVDFNDGSLLLASEMDKMAAQLLHVEEENSDFLLNSAMVTDDDGAWQGRGRRIKNLRDPQQPQDVVTLNYLDGVGVARQDELQRIEQAVRADKERALSFKNDAASSAQSAASSASSSAQYADASEVSRQASAVIENNIKGVQNTIRDMQNHVNGVSAHVDGVKTSVETIAVRVASDSQHASDEAGKAHSSAEASAQSAAASEASAKRAEQASKLEGIVKSENIADGAITKTKIGFTAADIDTYTKSETNTLLAPKAPLASPALTGTPTAPTAGRGTNNGQIATTAFVVQSLGDAAPSEGSIHTKHISNGAITLVKMATEVWDNVKTIIRSFRTSTNVVLVNCVPSFAQTEVIQGVTVYKTGGIPVQLENTFEGILITFASAGDLSTPSYRYIPRWLYTLGSQRYRLFALNDGKRVSSIEVTKEGSFTYNPTTHRIIAVQGVQFNP